MKRELLEALIQRMEHAYSNKYYLEAISYAYALVEDRLNSALRQSGGTNYKNGKPIRNLGSKIAEINNRRPKDSLLNVYFNNGLMDALKEWKDDRDELMHALANGNMSLAELDKKKYLVAEKSKKLFSKTAADAARLKTHRDKVKS